MLCNGERLSIVIPTIDEAENLAVLLPRLNTVVEQLGLDDVEIIIVDGGSTDDTAAVVEANAARFVQQEGRGYGAAIKTGIRHAKGEIVICHDGDNSHPPNYLPRMLEAIKDADLVIASRYTAGGSADVSAFRRLLSLILNAWYRWGLDVPYLDMSSGFRCYRRAIFEDIEVEADGYQFLPELLVRAHCAGYRVVEIPFHYAPRLAGASHIRLLRFGIAYVACFLRMWAVRNSCNAADYDWRGFYSRHFAQRYWQRKRHQHVLALIGRDAGHVVDVGCGSSKILADLPSAIGVDISQPKLRFMRRTNKLLVKGCIPCLPFPDDCFDTVLCSQVIEHIPAAGALEELVRICRTGGTLVIGTPDYGTWRWPTIEWFYGKLNPSGYKDDHITHYCKSDLYRRLEELGVEITDERTIVDAELIVKGIKRSV